MANALFDNYKNLLLGDDGAAHTLPDMDTHDIRLICVDHTDDTPAPTTDQDLADITAGARVATSNSLDSPSITTGAIDFADEVLSSVSGDQFESIVVYYHTGTESTSPLIIFYDTATGLPFTPSGGDITIAWNASGLYSF